MRGLPERESCHEEMKKSSDVPVKESITTDEIAWDFFATTRRRVLRDVQSENMFEALKKNGYLDEEGYLRKTRALTGDVVCGSLRDKLAPDSPCENNKSWTSELMNVAWASQEMRVDTFVEI